jgi:CRISPR-associated protein Csy1
MQPADASITAQAVARSENVAATRAVLERACEESPTRVELWQALAQATLHMGDHAAAHAAIERALALEPQNGPLLLLAFDVFQGAGAFETALTMAGRIDRHSPLFAQARNRAGLLLADLGRHVEAEAAFRDAIGHTPSYFNAYGNLAVCLVRLGRSADAAAAAARAVEIRPDYAHGYFAIALALNQQGNAGAAVSALQAALQRQPQFADALMLLARIHSDHHSIEQALAAIRQLLSFAPERVDAMAMLGALLLARGDLAGGRAAYDNVLARQPQHLEAALRGALSLPIAYGNRQQVDDARASFASGLERLQASVEMFGKMPANELLAQIQYCNFYLAYQGRDDLALQRQYSKFVTSLLARALPDCMAPLEPGRPGVRRIRIGFFSRFFYDSTAGNYFASWITDLNREDFEVYVYHANTRADALTERVRARADHFVQTDAKLDTAARGILTDQLDILIYPELGMDTRTFITAACRLAPVQIAGWGHPVTSGHDNIDYFLSCKEMEPEGAQLHYHEKLLLLPGLGTRYPRPPVTAAARTKQREDFQLPVDKVLYLVPQSLFKIHPDNDILLVDILAGDPNGVLVMFAGQAQAAMQIFIARLTRAFADRKLSPQGRVKILPDVSRDDYLRINELCDLMLDTLHWSGGNTSLDALASGLPIVTLPGKFMRGRQSMAMLHILGIDELIAHDRSEYVSLALKLGRDPALRRELSSRIADSVPKLFDRQEPVAALAEILRDLAAGGSTGATAHH